MTTDTLTLTDFLLARIAEDEAAASEEGTSPHGPHCATFGGDYAEDCDCAYPARLLAECEAKRRIVEIHAEMPTTLEAVSHDGGEFLPPDTFEEIVGRDVNCLACAGYPSAPCPTLRTLALPYADHPDYRFDEWRP